jgi:uncharacterized protein YtpQ (UPF0354 family)
MTDEWSSDETRAEAFTDRALELVREIWPDVGWQRAGPLQLLGDREGSPFNVGLLNAYQATSELTDTEEIETLLTAFLRALPMDMPSLDTVDMETVRERIFPMLKSSAFLEVANSTVADADKQPVYRPWESDLIVTLVLDTPSNVTYLRACDLARWNIDFDALLTVALDNLEAESEGLPLKMGRPEEEDKDSAFIVIDSGDGYDATRILLRRQRSFLAEYLGPEYLVGVPNRDFLIAFTFDLAKQFAPIIRDDAHQRQYPLSSQILLVTPDGVEVWRGL